MPKPDWESIRKLFPALENLTYLNTASGCVMSSMAADEGRRYFDEMNAYGDVKWPEWLQRAESVRQNLAEFMGASPHEIAFLPNASLGVNHAQSMLAPGAGVLMVGGEFPSVSLPWIAAKRPVHFVAPEPDGTVSLESLSAGMDDSTGVLAASHVSYSTGFRFDLKELGAFCRERGLVSVIDVTQSLGAYPLDLGECDVDCVVFSGYKWMGAGYAVGGMYVRREVLQNAELPGVGWRSARVPYDLTFDRLDLSTEASALEMGHPPIPGVLALGGALGLFRQIGIDEIRTRIESLSDYLHHQLDAAGIEVHSTRDPKHRSGITTVAVESPVRAAEALRKRQVVVSVRNGLIRVSAHFYNLERDIDRFVETLRGSA